MRKLDSQELAEATGRTIGHYNARAEAFRAGTWDHDVSQNRGALLRHIVGDAPFRILDLGCGPGRDLVTFRDQGHEPTGLDGAEQFCVMARRLSGCEVLHQDMLELDLPGSHYDGVFANASLFHVPTAELPEVLARLWEALVPGGVLFSSNPRGDNREGWQGERYGAYHDYDRWTAVVSSCGFTELEHYYRPPGQPRELQPWLATVFRKSERISEPATPRRVR